MKKYIVLGVSAFVNIVTAWSHYDDTKNLPQLQYQPATFYKELTIHGIISACDQAVGSKSLE